MDNDDAELIADLLGTTARISRLHSFSLPASHSLTPLVWEQLLRSGALRGLHVLRAACDELLRVSAGLLLTETPLLHTLEVHIDGIDRGSGNLLSLADVALLPHLTYLHVGLPWCHSAAMPLHHSFTTAAQCTGLRSLILEATVHAACISVLSHSRSPQHLQHLQLRGVLKCEPADDWGIAMRALAEHAALRSLTLSEVCTVDVILAHVPLLLSLRLLRVERVELPRSTWDFGRRAAPSMAVLQNVLAALPTCTVQLQSPSPRLMDQFRHAGSAALAEWAYYALLWRTLREQYPMRVRIYEHGEAP